MAMPGVQEGSYFRRFQMRGLMIAGALVIGAMGGIAQAAVSAPECTSLGPVSGNGSYWVYEPGSTEIVYGTEVEWAGNSGNGFVSVTEITTPGTCVGYNNGGNPKGDEWIQEIGTGGTTELDPLKVCQNVQGGGSTQTPESVAIGDYECNP
jgi:plastocyanin